MRNAVDFSYARPSGQELAGDSLDALFYTGNARPDQGYIDNLRANGVAVTFVQETNSGRSLEGYQAGVYDAQFADGRADQRNYPREASICYVVSDGSRDVPSSGGDAISAYGKGVADASLRPFFFYGNRYAVSAAISGANTNKCLGSWVPSTWNSDPSVDLLIQEANIASPIGDTDFNTVYKLYGAWGQTVSVTSTVPMEDDMQIVIGPVLYGQMAYLLAGSTKLAEWGTDPNRPDVFGVPAAAVDWNSAPGRGYEYKFLDKDAMNNLIKAQEPQKVNVTLTAAQLDTLATEVAAKVPHNITGQLT